jgi:hypothetical protein
MSVILIDSEGLCFCSCADKCVLGKCGMSQRCTKEQIENLGYRTFQVYDKKSEKEIRDAMVIDGYDYKLKIKKVKSKLKPPKIENISEQDLKQEEKELFEFFTRKLKEQTKIPYDRYELL